MGLFEPQVEEVQRFIEGRREAGVLRELSRESTLPWPSESSLVLRGETALELGNPRLGSLYYFMYTEERHDIRDEILLLGPDLDELPQGGAPFAEIVTVLAARFEEAYAGYRSLRDAVYDTRLRGLMVRRMPSRQTVNFRVDRRAMAGGLSLAHLGAAMRDNLEAIPQVEAVQTLFITSGKADLDPLCEPGRQAGRIVGAMVKMTEEMSYDCPTCEYRDVCDTVVDLKKIRKRLQEGSA